MNVKEKLRPYYADYVKQVRLEKLANPDGRLDDVIRDGIRTRVIQPVADALPFEEWSSNLITEYTKLLLQQVAQFELRGNASPAQSLVNEELIEFYQQLIEDVK